MPNISFLSGNRGVSIATLDAPYDLVEWVSMDLCLSPRQPKKLEDRWHSLGGNLCFGVFVAFSKSRFWQLCLVIFDTIFKTSFGRDQVSLDKKYDDVIFYQISNGYTVSLFKLGQTIELAYIWSATRIIPGGPFYHSSLMKSLDHQDYNCAKIFPLLLPQLWTHSGVDFWLPHFSQNSFIVGRRAKKFWWVRTWGWNFQIQSWLWYIGI